MSFTLPWVLAGLVAAALPLLLHLVQRREVPEKSFPAVRYLEDATRDQQRRLRFRHRLLLIVRTVLIVALVLAAAGASLQRRSFGPHAATALVLLVDNSAPSGAFANGTPELAALVRAGTDVLSHATLSDQLWLVTADGIARPGTAAQLRQQLLALTTVPVHLDLGRMVASGRDLLRRAGRTGHLVLLTTLPANTISASPGDLLVLRPAAKPPANRGIVNLVASTQPWSPTGGQVTVGIVAADSAPVPVTLSVAGRALREVLVTPGIPSTQRVGPQAPGWTTITAALPPDEFRLDDSRSIAVRIAPPPAVAWDTTDRYIAAAAEVLAADGRIRAGNGVHLDGLQPGPSVVLPPTDPARVGSINRALAARGVSWRFGAPVTTPARLDSGALVAAPQDVTMRYTLEHPGSSGEVLATVDGAPWLVRDGNVVLAGSRFDPAWTTLPLSAAFIPFLDGLLTGVGSSVVSPATAVAGEPFLLPQRTSSVVHDAVALRQDGSRPWTPETTGVFYPMVDADTLGAVSVVLDARASQLTRAPDDLIDRVWPGATVAGLVDGPALAFATGARSDLRGPLLFLALCCALAETMLVGRLRLRN